MSDIFDQLKQLADGKVYVNTTNGGNAILRSQATTMSAKLTTIPWGTELDAIGYEAGGQSADGSGFTFWYKVNYNGKTGFVFGKLLSNVKPTGPKPSSGSGGSSGGGSSEDKVVTVLTLVGSGPHA